MSDPGEGSITHWINVLKAGDSTAELPLFNRYYKRIVGLARARLGPSTHLGADEEDAALSVLHDLLEGAPQGKFPLLDDRGDLWNLLAVITARKVVDLRKRASRLKRGGNHLLGEVNRDEDVTWDNLADRSPTPEFAVILAEECRRRIEILDPPFQEVALLRLDGYSNEEIAEKIGCSTRTVLRRVDAIRDAWRRQAG